VWQVGIDLVSEIYAATRWLPEQERYGLTAQMCRAAVSVPSNIAEGQGRTGQAELRHSLSIALGSLAEVETHLVIAQRLHGLSSELVDRLTGKINQLRAMLLRMLMKLS